MSEDIHQPVTILGAGIVGICTALSLAERGAKVRIIDRAEPGQATSFGNAGVISPWSIIPQSMPGLVWKLPGLMFGKYRPLSILSSAWPAMLGWGVRFLQNGTERRVRSGADAMEVLCAPSIDLYRRHLNGTGAEDLLVDSCYVHAFRDGSRATLDGLDYRIRAEKGGMLELVGRDELRRLEPALSPEFEAAVLIRAQARTLSPGRLGQVLAAKAERLGVEILCADIRGIERRDGHWDIHCADGTRTAPRIVLAMGAWSPEILKGLGLRVPLMAERGYHVECPAPGTALQNSVMDVDAKFVASSMEGGLRIAGQAEFGAVDAPATPRKSARILAQAKAALPELDTREARFWMGRRPAFPDSLPALGPVNGFDGLYCNFGHSHYGLMMAPKSGELIAEQLTCRTQNIDLAPYAIERFGRRRGSPRG